MRRIAATLIVVILLASAAVAGGVPWGTRSVGSIEADLTCPVNLEVVKTDDGVRVFHSIPYVYTDPCDLSGEPRDLHTLFDFDLSIQVVDRFLMDAIAERFPSLPPAKRRPVPAGDLYSVMGRAGSGYSLTIGSHGCGERYYFLEFGEGRTLVAVWRFAPDVPE